MGMLRRVEGGAEVRLGERSIVGRSTWCTVRLHARGSSGEHAVLFWDAGSWYVRDLGSTNGTRLDGKAVAKAERAAVPRGATLVFGDAVERWTLVDAAPPTASARCELTGEICVAEHGLLALPDATSPQVTLFEDAEGRWLIEIEGAVRLAVDGELIEAGPQWSLAVPAADEAARIVTTELSTEDAPRLVQSLRLRFEVSQDEEHIALSLIDGARVISLGAHPHNEVLLALARSRLRDQAASVAPLEQGWLYVDDLRAMLNLDLQHFNVNVFRARQKLARTGVIDAGSVFERRSMTRQIRLGVDAVEIVTS
jgi:FHA domain